MHFTYKEPSSEDIMQGDVLYYDSPLKEVIERYHPYYAQNPVNTHYIVLTQSCDLVRRSSSPQKSKYINLAAVRPLSVYLNEVITRVQEKGYDLDYPLCTLDTKNKIIMLLERLINNNEPKYFFLRADPTLSFPEDSCAYLQLSIAIHSNEHYEKCLKSRILQLKESFQAKLGHMIGDMYSRVGTADWEKKDQKEYIRDTINSLGAYWVDKKSLGELRDLIDEYKRNNPGATIDANALDKIIDSIPDRKQKVINRVRELLSEEQDIRELIDRGELSQRDLDSIIKRIEKDKILTSYLK